MKPMNNFIHPLDQDAQPCMQLPARGFQWINLGVDPCFNCCRPISESLNQEAVVVIDCLARFCNLILLFVLIRVEF